MSLSAYAAIPRERTRERFKLNVASKVFSLDLLNPTRPVAANRLTEPLQLTDRHDPQAKLLTKFLQFLKILSCFARRNGGFASAFYGAPCRRSTEQSLNL